MAKADKLFPIGYEQTPAKAVLDELEHAGVKLLVDVRAVVPGGWTAIETPPGQLDRKGKTQRDKRDEHGPATRGSHRR